MATKNVQKTYKIKHRSFTDDDHDVMIEYYDILEKGLPASELLSAMEQLIEKDPDFYDPYLISADILLSEAKYEDALLFVGQAYNKADARIRDEKDIGPMKCYGDILKTGTYYAL